MKRTFVAGFLLLCIAAQSVAALLLPDANGAAGQHLCAAGEEGGSSPWLCPGVDSANPHGLTRGQAQPVRWQRLRDTRRRPADAISIARRVLHRSAFPERRRVRKPALLGRDDDSPA